MKVLGTKSHCFLPDLSDIDRAEPTLDAVQHYLQEIGRVALLTAAEEVELAEQIERGNEAEARLNSAVDLTPRNATNYFRPFSVVKRRVAI